MGIFLLQLAAGLLLLSLLTLGDNKFIGFLLFILSFSLAFWGVILEYTPYYDGVQVASQTLVSVL